MQSFDVAIIGAGPAGAASALRLAQRGWRVLVIDRLVKARFKIGEGLPPVAGRVLRELSLWSQFEADGHLEALGNASAWSSAELTYTDFLSDPTQGGWHLNRARFDAMLREAAATAGATIQLGTKLHAFEQTDAGWVLQLSAENQPHPVYASWVIDASGRSAWFARRMGTKVETQDRQIALVARFRSADPEQLTLLEATEAGWWYSARVPNDERVVAFHTDADLIDGLWNSAEFLAAASQTTHIAKRLAKATLLKLEAGCAAGSQRLTQVAGERWLAVGDAALAFDPLSSQGIYTALYAAIKASDTIDDALANRNADTSQYAHALDAVWSHYRQRQTGYYQDQQRWPLSPYWQRRQN